MRHMFVATEHIPMNFAFTGKGNDSGPQALEDIIKAGAAGLKLHEVRVPTIRKTKASDLLAGLGIHACCYHECSRCRRQV
jgi:urease alpha subunit